MDGSMLGGINMPQSTYCKEKCRTYECLKFNSGEKECIPVFYTCAKGFSVAVVKIDESLIRINGVIEAITNTAPPKFKKEQKSRKLKLPELERWISAFSDVYSEYEKHVESKAKEAVHALHDIKSLIGSVLTTTEQYINEQDGKTIDEKIEASPTHIQTIYHSCEMLQSLLQITDILTNPAVAQFGTAWAISVYGVILKLIKIHENKALSQNKKIILRGRSINKVKLYSSFIIIPHILIDNAIKHADKDTDIRVWIQDKDNGEIKVDFSSFGQLVPEEERELIFQRGVRGSNVRAKGSGLGLYIAQLVAKANGFQVSYSAKPTGILGRSKGYNHFIFTVPVSAPKHTYKQSLGTATISSQSIYGR
jgi:K+-sensing histidine kinase KdpD